MKPPVILWVSATSLILGAIGSAATIILMRSPALTPPQPIITAERLTATLKLVTQQYETTVDVPVSKERFPLPGGWGSTTLTAQVKVVILAGFKLPGVVEQAGDKTVVTLPPAEILWVGVDPNQSSIKDVKQGLLSDDQYIATLPVEAQRRAVKEALERACKAGILDKASEGGSEVVSRMFHNTQVNFGKTGECK
jgi:Protein of unknown function (DUF4230)